MIAPKTISHARGSVLMEFIIVCPLMLIIISAILQFAHIWIAREVTAYAAYCATRAVLSAQSDEQEDAARCAAEMACSWMALAGLSTTVVAKGDEENVNLPRLHDKDDISDTDSVDSDNGARVSGEVEIPGWGTIPGSDSISKRIDVKIVKKGGRDGCACVAVRFKFPLLMPLVGRMISWTANEKGDATRVETDYGFHDMTGGSNPGWSGEQTVMDDEGNVVDAAGLDWGAEGKFPVICLTEACVLPMSYTGDNLYAGAFTAKHVPKYGGDK